MSYRRSAVSRRFTSLLLELALIIGLSGTARVSAQEHEDRTLLPFATIQGIVDEVSGDRAMQHLLELAPYSHDRKAREYETVFAESAYLKSQLDQFGVPAQIETFALGQAPTWDGERGELWMLRPRQAKLLDYHDMAAMLASNSESGDWSGELVDVGVGASAADYEGLDVAGKIVLGDASPGILQRLAVFDRGASGVISDNSLRPSLDPQQTLWQGIAAVGPDEQSPGFGFKITPELARELRRQLSRGDTITLRAVVESRTFPGRMELVHARIPGDGSSEQEIILSAHVYEGYAKQGANDDGSGSATLLEIARALNEMIANGAIPRPPRAINFLWVPEISGTMAWLQRHAEEATHLIADINMDMVGESLQLNNSFFTLHRTPDSTPTFLNDVMASLIQFVGNTNRERVRYRADGYRMSYPIVSPNGTRDPFYTVIDKHYGASDHVVYLGAGIPAIMMIAWPDMFYHSSQDTPDKADPTQLKRAGVIATAGAIVVAGADEAMGLRIAGEVMGRGDARIGQALRKAQAYVADAGTEAEFISSPGTPVQEALAVAYKEGVVAIRHAVAVEMEALRSTGVLLSDSPDRTITDHRLAPLAARLSARQQAALDELLGYLELVAEARGVFPVDLGPSDAEMSAAQRIPKLTAAASGFGYFRLMGQMSTQQRRAIGAVPSTMSSELRALIDGERSILQIRNALSGEFEPVPLAAVVGYLDALVAVGAAEFAGDTR